MCGIAGICNYRNNETEDILAMNQKMHHRGPDSGAYWTDEKSRVIFGHRRLSIVDLSTNGAQPMHSHSGRYVISYNGEIYNYKEVLAKLQQDGGVTTLNGSSDTEVILEAFSLYGVEKTLPMLKGMFAIALWDRQDQVLYLMRDRLGEKPLYYGYVNGSFVFASELSCIKAIKGFCNPIHKEVLGLYFQYGYIPMPYSIYKDIYKLEPGKVLKAKVPFSEYTIHTYWDLMQVAHKGQNHLYQGSEAEAAGELERLLKRAISKQMVADVPLGAFLSGGIDSSLVVSLMQSQSDRKVRTFTIGFEEDAYNEAVYAKEIAAHLGTEHTEMYVNKQMALEVIEELPKAFSEPFADSSQIPTMLVSKLTRQHVTVSLSGDGGDELFCGYNTYLSLEKDLENIRNRFGMIPQGLQTVIGGFCQKIYTPRTQTLGKVAQIFGIDTPEELYAAAGLLEAGISKYGNGSKILPCNNAKYPQGFLQETKSNIMLMDLLQYHTDDILAKVDRAGMYYSLETRIPLLDPDVVEFSWRLPESFKYDNGVTKKILRNILYRHVPREMIERPKKGFSLPIGKWLKEGQTKEWAESIIQDGRTHLKEYLNVDVVDRYWKDYTEKGNWTSAIWRILMLEQWLLAELQ